ncbi:MAG TPA: hypothetical protein VK537_05150, partial [Galbitalea sp.]|nr:hypothetical protein [Galbitalea sp.]
MSNDAAIATAVDVISMARAGEFAEVAKRFAPQLQALVSGAAIETAWNGELARVGPVQSLGTPTATDAITGIVTV